MNVGTVTRETSFPTIEQPEVWKLEFDVISHPGIPI